MKIQLANSAPCNIEKDHNKHDIHEHVWDPAHEIRRWGMGKDLGVTQIHEIIHLLDPKHLQSLHVRRKSKKRPKTPANNNFRYHFYR